MNEYKVTLELSGKVDQVIINAENIEYKDGFILFYIKGELVTSVFAPDSIIKKP